MSLVLNGVFLVAVASSRTPRDVPEMYGTQAERLVHHNLTFLRPKPSLAVPGPRTTEGTRGRVAERRRAPRPQAPAQRTSLTSALRAIELRTPITDIVPVGAAGPDYAAMASAGIDLGGNNLGGGIGSAIGTAYARPDARGAYSADVVDRQAWPRPGNPVPEYPRRLLRQGIEAAYMMKFVVDSSGRVDMESVSAPEDAHELFVAAIRKSLARSRYLPATLGGKPVAQLVQQQFRFVIAR